jgi:outer membrane protein assembly factor BamB
LRINSRFLAVAVLSLVALAGCGETKNKIGSTTKGTRLAVLERKETIEPDRDLSGQKPQPPETVSNAAWPQAGFDATHVMPNAEIADAPKVLWRHGIGEGSDSDFKLLASPVIGGGLAFAMDSRGQVSAFNALTGERKWKFDTAPKNSDHEAIGGGLGYYDTVLYATTGFGEVLALNGTDGKLLWRRMLFNPIRAAPTIAEGRVYAVSIDNQLNALDVKTGEQLWHHNGIAESATLMGASSPAVVSGGVVVAYSSGEIFDLRAENGRVAWNYGLTTPTQVGAMPAIADIHGEPVVDRGRVFAVSHSGRLASIDQRTGDRDWEADIGGVDTPVVAGEAVYVLSNDNQLIALTRDSGRIIWVHDLPGTVDPKDKSSDRLFWSGPVMAGGKLWLATSDGHLRGFATQDGAEAGKIYFGDPLFMPPVVAGGIIYAVTDGGELVAMK